MCKGKHLLKIEGNISSLECDKTEEALEDCLSAITSIDKLPLKITILVPDDFV